MAPAVQRIPHFWIICPNCSLNSCLLYSRPQKSMELFRKDFPDRQKIKVRFFPSQKFFCFIFSLQTDCKSLLRQLIRLQNENLTMQRQRLNIERQRLDVEKNLGSRIIDLLSTLQNSIQPIPSSRTSYRLRREKRANHQSSGDEDKDWSPSN